MDVSGLGRGAQNDRDTAPLDARTGQQAAPAQSADIQAAGNYSSHDGREAFARTRQAGMGVVSLPHGESRDIRVATKLKAMGVRRGIPDFVLVPSSGRSRTQTRRFGTQRAATQLPAALHCAWHPVCGLSHPRRGVDRAKSLELLAN
jgi:hypothetical protein